MSRQAKYRQPVFAEKTGDFLYWHYWGWMNKGEFIGPLSMGHNVKEEMGQQYTGLNDKNEAPIYEGDIIQHIGFAGHIKSVIEWNDSRMGWTDFHPREEFIVVGNIYESPELLEEGK